MPGLPPLYKTEKATYQADSCQPVIDAVTSGQIRYEAFGRDCYPGRRLGHGDLAGVSLVGFWDAKFDQDWGLDWHRNEGVELTLLESGALAYSCDGIDHQLEPGYLTIGDPGSRIASVILTSRRAVCIS